MANRRPIHVKTISEFHKFNGLPKPEHPLISIVDYDKLNRAPGEEATALIFGYYTISLKRGVSKMFYGQQEYDFDEGVLYFMAPNQVLRTNPNPDDTLKRSGWLLLIHPDFLWNTPLATKIKQYEFFDYSVNEALFLSEKEEAILNNIIRNIQQEYRTILINSVRILLSHR